MHNLIIRWFKDITLKKIAKNSPYNRKLLGSDPNSPTPMSCNEIHFGTTTRWFLILPNWNSTIIMH